MKTLLLLVIGIVVFGSSQARAGGFSSNAVENYKPNLLVVNPSDPIRSGVSSGKVLYLDPFTVGVKSVQTPGGFGTFSTTFGSGSIGTVQPSSLYTPAQQPAWIQADPTSQVGIGTIYGLPPNSSIRSETSHW